jgi:hypothetical protein
MQNVFCNEKLQLFCVFPMSVCLTIRAGAA